MIRSFGSDNGKLIFILLIEVIAVYVIFPIYISGNRALKRRSQRLFENIIGVGTRAYAFVKVLKIYCKSFSIYLAIDGAEKEASKAKVG